MVKDTPPTDGNAGSLLGRRHRIPRGIAIAQRLAVQREILNIHAGTRQFPGSASTNLVLISSFLDRFTRGGAWRGKQNASWAFTVPVRGFPVVKFEEAVI
jgi:hypothetical protein